MYWTGFRKVYSLLGLFAVVTISSCSSDDKNLPTVEKSPEDQLTEEQWIVRKIESELNIPATEKYGIEIIYKHINPDTLMDALILVNRKEHALNHVKNNGTEAFFERTGQTGGYNYVFVKLGGAKDVISTTPVGSNINYSLKAEFLELTSKAFTDFYVDYRIKNSLQRNYYTLRGNNLHLTFSCPIFDGIGDPKPVVYDIRYLDSPVRMTKDIALFHARLKDYKVNEIEDVNHYEAKGIESTEDLYVYFIFDEKTMKYKSPMKAPEVEEE